MLPVSCRRAWLFEVEFVNLVSVHHDDAGLFRVGGVDEHFLGH
jgi:hypothetical protein